MKNGKKAASFLCALMMFVSLFTFSISADYVNEIEEKAELLLCSIENSKSYYGLENVDFSAISLGHEIPAYEFTSEGFERIGTIHYYPLISENTWVATITSSYNSDGELCLTLSTDYVSDSENCTNTASSNGIMLVFDKEHGYLFDGNDYVIIESYTVNESRETLYTNNNYSLPPTATVRAHITLDIPSYAKRRVAGDSVFLDVPAIRQPTNYTCWAASIASILNYYGENEDVESVCDAAGVDLYTYQNARQSSQLIENEYGYTCGTDSDSNYYYSLYIDNLIIETYYNENPLFAGFATEDAINNGAGVGHAVVIQGYVYMDGLQTMSYMDPGSANYKASTVPNSGNVTIVSNGITLDLTAAFAVS